MKKFYLSPIFRDKKDALPFFPSFTRGKEIGWLGWLAWTASPRPASFLLAFTQGLSDYRRMRLNNYWTNLISLPHSVMRKEGRKDSRWFLFFLFLLSWNPWQCLKGGSVSTEDSTQQDSFSITWRERIRYLQSSKEKQRDSETSVTFSDMTFFRTGGKANLSLRERE